MQFFHVCPKEKTGKKENQYNILVKVKRICIKWLIVKLSKWCAIEGGWMRVLSGVTLRSLGT